MTCETARERLQDQIDGTLDPASLRLLERHVQACASCRGFSEDLAAIADAAASLDAVEPPEHVWLQLAGRWRHEHGTTGTLPFSRPSTRRYTRFHVLAAAAMLAVAAGGSWVAWRATGGDTGAAPHLAAGLLLERTAVPASTGNAAPDVLVESARADLEAAEQLYARAIEGLERAASAQKTSLAPEVASVIDKNLEVLDQAIVQSRAAVQAQPASPEARDSLFEALRKKVALLQNTIALVSEISRGNQAGASRLAGT